MKFKTSFLFIPLLLLSSCGSGEGDTSFTPTPSSQEPSSQGGERREIVVEEREVQYIDDFYRNYYQIFPYAYADSNGDKVGDLKGICDKFNYIKSLNITGLWLTPVHPSQDYHKYSVKDYKAIDSQFGSLNDYDNLVTLCHNNHMTIILDLVFNHSSNQHPWFTSCMEAHINNQTSNKYYNYYNVKAVDSKGQIPDGWREYRYVNNKYYIYEGRFDTSMPDLNLQSVLDGTNTNLINDLKDIMRFWLIDHHVDGFRLDACTSFFTGDNEKNYQFLNWLKAEAEIIKPNTYIIGEVLSGITVYGGFYQNTNIDSYFCFADTANYSNRVYSPILQENATKIATYISSDIKSAGDAVPAPLLANHDIGRSYKKDPNKNKLVHALLALDNGATFEYYGDEAAMANVFTNIEDQGYRMPMYWGDNYTCNPITSEGTMEQKYPQGSVATLNSDPDSILNYYRKVYKTRLQNPELARGSLEALDDEHPCIYQNDDKSCAIIKRAYNGSNLYIVANLSATNEQAIDLSSLGLSNLKIVADLSVGDTPYYLGSNLVMTPQSILLIH